MCIVSLLFYLSMRLSIIYNVATLVTLVKDPRSCPNTHSKTSIPNSYIGQSRWKNPTLLIIHSSHSGIFALSRGYEMTTLCVPLYQERYDISERCLFLNLPE